jgi:chromosome segregation ATPase
MSPPRSPRSVAGTIALVVGLGSSVALVGLLARQVARERERNVRTEGEQKGAQNQLVTTRSGLREAREEIDRLEADRARREKVVEGETALLRRDLADAVQARDALDRSYRAAASERDRATGDLLAARREIESLRTDLARAVRRAEQSEESAKAEARASEDCRKRLAQATARVESLLRPLLQDLRSADGSIRVRAHEALCAFAGHDLAFRPNGTPEEREADAKGLEASLLAK